MQNVLLMFPYQIDVRNIAEVLNTLFPGLEHSDETPSDVTLINGDDHIFLHQYYNIKENYDQWFDESQYDLAMSMVTFIELQYRKLHIAKKILSLLAFKYKHLVIQFDDFSLDSVSFISRLEREPEWDWR